jgi:ketosteroid isomerase-like protein
MTRPADPATTLRRYLEALDRFDVETVLDCFTEDVFYSHPGNEPTGGSKRMEVRGRDSLRQFLHDRGPRPIRHQITKAAAQDATVFVAGGVDLDGAPMASFISLAELDESGRIRRYETYASLPPVGTWC